MKLKLAQVSGTAILPSNADAVDRTKHEICRQIVLYMHTHTLTQRKLAEKLGVPETRVSEIVHYRTKKFTIDRLLSHLETLNPNVNIHVA